MFGLFSKDTGSGSIRLYNTASRKVMPFRPLHRGKVLMYSCGPTVYDHVHIGNLRAYLLPDLLRRLFLYHGNDVKLVINVTDFGHLTDDADAGEDKIMSGMKRAGLAVNLENMRSYVLPYIDSFKDDLARFGTIPPTELVRASDFVREQIALIESLVEKGYAYETTDGVYFDISRFPRYGVLGNLDIGKLRAGARVEQNPEKRHPADFAVWKKGELGWKSKWGLGFPGWHIECTAMIFARLGKQIDIHTGGEDLMYTHHNAEIAQAESVTGRHYVNHWLHNAFVTIGDDRMAKSKGTGLTLATLAERGYSPLEYRYWLLQSHYRTPANFSYEALEGAKQALRKLQRLVYEDLGNVRPGKSSDTHETQFIAALGNDLDTPKALAIMWELVKDASIADASKLATLHVFDSLLSLGLSETLEAGKRMLGHVAEDDIPEEVRMLLAERAEARAQKEWARADQARDELSRLGYAVKDTENGQLLSKNV